MNQFSLLKQPQKKTTQKSLPQLKLPHIKQKFGPNTPLINPYSSMRNLILPRSTLLGSLSPQRSPSISPNFIDSLISKYESPRNNNASYISFIKIDPVKVHWTTLSTVGFIPDARTGATMSIINRVLYIFGGERSDQSNDIKKLDYRSLQWERIAALNANTSETPTLKTGHTAVTYRTSIVIYGGFHAFDASLQIRNCNSLVYCFDVNANIWKSHKPTGMSPEPRRGHAAALVGCSLAIYSGMDSKGDLVESLAVLNLETMHWGNPRIRSAPPARKGCSLTPVYPPTTLEHFHFDIYSVPKHFDSQFTKKNTGVYMFGGLSSSGAALNDLYLFKGRPYKRKPGLMEIVWKRIQTSGQEPIPRHGHSSNLCGGFFIIMGGRNDAVLGGVVEELAILRVSNMRWESVIATGTGPNGRVGASTATLGSKLLLLGGMNLIGFAASTLFELETDPKKLPE